MLGDEIILLHANRARKEADIYRRVKTQIRPAQKLLPINEGKPYYIPLPFKLKAIAGFIEDAVESGMNFIKINNEITAEAEEQLKDKGYKVKYYKSFIKVSW